jgi:ABC-type multidrug transport system permease subunit
LTVVGSLMAGEVQFIWGRNIVLIILVILAVAGAATGVGALVTALVRTPEQGNIIGGVISILFALFGGAFFDITALGPARFISYFTVNYWGVDAFAKLSLGDTQVFLNLAVLTVIGIVFFTVGMIVFNRRLEV